VVPCAPASAAVLLCAPALVAASLKILGNRPGPLPPPVLPLWSSQSTCSAAIAPAASDDANEVDCRGPQQPIAAVVVVVEVVRGDDSCRQRLVRASAPRRGGAAQPAAAATTKGG